MSVRRVVGTEVEYGVSVPGQPAANAMLASSQVVNAYAPPHAAGRMRWDYEEENPLRDARGFDGTPPDVSALGPQTMGEDEGALANLVLTNGARLYVDHAHPEYSSPETTGPLDAVRWDKAGERVMAEAARRAASAPGGSELRLYKNNTDGKGASYGSHENYLVARATPFADLVRHLVPFFVTRQVVCGSGRVGRGTEGQGRGYQLSQRADFFEVEVGLETTLKRPIVNTRDEPHADPDRFRRLHVIIGDANLCEVSTWLKLGTTSLVLSMIEDGWLAGVDWWPERAVPALQAVSHDPTLTRTFRLRDGRSVTALELQREFCEQARAHVSDRWGEHADRETSDVLDRWESVLDRLGRDVTSCAREVDWVAKLRLLEGLRDREGLDWDAPKLAAVDLQYSDVRPDRGLYNRLVARGAVERLLSEEEVLAAVDAPPTDTRAYFRGQCMARYGADVAAASWDSVVFDVGRESLQRVPTLEPLRGTQAHVGALLDRCATARELVEALGGR